MKEIFVILSGMELRLETLVAFATKQSAIAHCEFMGLEVLDDGAEWKPGAVYIVGLTIYE